MPFTRYIAPLVAAMALTPEQGVMAHGTDHGTAAQAGEVSGGEISVTAQADPDAAVPAVVRVPLGAHVHLTVAGAGADKLHLHGYDVEAEAGGEGGAVIVFDAVHEGRFPLEMHVEDDILGRYRKPVLFVEVRAP